MAQLPPPTCYSGCRSENLKSAAIAALFVFLVELTFITSQFLGVEYWVFPKKLCRPNRRTQICTISIAASSPSLPLCAKPPAVDTLYPSLGETVNDTTLSFAPGKCSGVSRSNQYGPRSRNGPTTASKQQTRTKVPTVRTTSIFSSLTFSPRTLGTFFPPPWSKIVLRCISIQLQSDRGTNNSARPGNSWSKLARARLAHHLKP